MYTVHNHDELSCSQSLKYEISLWPDEAAGRPEDEASVEDHGDIEKGNETVHEYELVNQGWEILLYFPQ